MRAERRKMQVYITITRLFCRIDTCTCPTSALGHLAILLQGHAYSSTKQGHRLSPKAHDTRFVQEVGVTVLYVQYSIRGTGVTAVHNEPLPLLLLLYSVVPRKFCLQSQQ